MAGLLVSVRSRAEALDALRGGASLIDVKEPSNGPLGRASVRAIREIREVVPVDVPMSAALGELVDASIDPPPAVDFVKLGLSNAPRDWRANFAARRLEAPSLKVKWVAVIYADWRIAGAPSPAEVLDVAMNDDAFGAVLIDTWDKSRSSLDGVDLVHVIGAAREGGRRAVIAGGLTIEKIERLATLKPDYFGVRGAACREGNRSGAIDPSRVRELAAAAGVTQPDQDRGITS